jgi:hypothetical protein
MRSRFFLPPPQEAGGVQPEETVVASQRLGKHVPAATNIYATIQEMSDPVFSVQSGLHEMICSERKVGG